MYLKIKALMYVVGYPLFYLLTRGLLHINKIETDLPHDSIEVALKTFVYWSILFAVIPVSFMLFLGLMEAPPPIAVIAFIPGLMLIGLTYAAMPTTVGIGGLSFACLLSLILVVITHPFERCMVEIEFPSSERSLHER
ncbi:MAG: hypothetical protein HZC02_01575 [Candidatus Levybacteria bacterium]|nr:hypothetical protein [Candidatus Levybacteria bacterium]